MAYGEPQYDKSELQKFEIEELFSHRKQQQFNLQHYVWAGVVSSVLILMPLIWAIAWVRVENIKNNAQVRIIQIQVLHK